MLQTLGNLDSGFYKCPHVEKQELFLSETFT